MKVHLWAFGAPSDDWVAKGEKIYTDRIGRYMPFEYKTHHATKQIAADQVLNAEGKWLTNQLLQTPAKLILLDEKGPSFTSVQFARQLEQWRQGTHKRLIFLIGSAYGFSQETYAAADHTMSISAMTLPHQLCRLLFLEQIYRACTILRGENYHHV